MRTGAAMLVASVVLVGAGAAITLLVTQVATSAPEPDLAAIERTATRALEIDEQITILPANMKAGHMTDDDRQALRAGIRGKYAEVFAGSAFTNRINGLLAWADRITVDGTQSHALSATIEAIRFDDVPLVSGDIVTVSGTYDLRSQQAWETATGVLVKAGGLYTSSFAMQLERRGNGKAWFVTSYSAAPGNFVPDPALEENLGVDPNPGATKPPSGDDAPPVPVDPAPPAP